MEAQPWGGGSGQTPDKALAALIPMVVWVEGYSAWTASWPPTFAPLVALCGRRVTSDRLPLSRHR